jgi:hypothetical protein
LARDFLSETAKAPDIGECADIAPAAVSTAGRVDVIHKAAARRSPPDRHGGAAL